MIELKPRKPAAIANGSIEKFQTGVDITIPEGHIGLLFPGKTERRNGYYEVTASIAPGCEMLPAGEYENLTVKLFNATATSLHYTAETVIANLVVIKCLDSSKVIGTGSSSESSSSSSSSSKNTSRGTKTGTKKKKAA